MASQFALRPVVHITRPSIQIARLTTTTRTSAVTSTSAATTKPAAAKPANPMRKPYIPAASRVIPKVAPKPPPYASPSPPPSSSESDGAIGPSLSSFSSSSPTTAAAASSYIPLPSAPKTMMPQNGNGNGNGEMVDWTTSYFGLGTARFPKEVVDILLQPVNPDDVEVKPDGIVYLPEIKYRRILNTAFGPGGWGLVPKGEVVVGDKIVTREYALIADGRFVSQAQGENSYFGLEGLPSAVEGCKSNALMRCCKDLGIASDLWDPVFIRKFKKSHAVEVWCDHIPSGKKKLVWTRKDVPVAYPFKKTS